MDIQREVLKTLDAALGLKGRTQSMSRESALLGALPEMDSMAVVSLLTGLEERFGFTIADDEVDASVFQNVGALTDFVADKIKT
jgi:acyl carrier protein